MNWPWSKPKVEPETLTTRLGTLVEVLERHNGGIVIGIGKYHRQFIEWRIVPGVFVNDYIIEEARARLEVSIPAGADE